MLLFLKQMPPNCVFEMPFCVKYLSEMYRLVRFCVIVLPWAFSHMIFCPGGHDFAAFYPEGGDFPLSKQIPRGSAGGRGEILTAGVY